MSRYPEGDRVERRVDMAAGKSKSVVIYWSKDCECEKGGCTINSFHVDGKNDDAGNVAIIVNFSAYRCAHCGKPWKQVQEEIIEDE